MIYRPCRRCRFAGACPIEISWKSGVRTLNRCLGGERVTSISFTCEKRWEGIEPGRRIEVYLPAWAHFDSEIESRLTIDKEEDTRLGWIMAIGVPPSPGKMEIWLDSESAAGKRRIRLWPENPPDPDDEERVHWRPLDERRPVEELRLEMEKAAAKYHGGEWQDWSQEPEEASA